MDATATTAGALQNGLQKSIYLVGPHSSGKTTIALALSKYYGPSVPLLKETARVILKEKGYTREDIEGPLCLQMQRDILIQQFKAEEQPLKGPLKLKVISDRAGIDPIVYCMKYSPNKEDYLSLCSTNEWTILKERYSDPEKSLVVLVEPCGAFLKDDGTRKMPLDFEEWKEFGDMFRGFLEREGIPYRRLGEGCLQLEERVRKITQWAD